MLAGLSGDNKWDKRFFVRFSEGKAMLSLPIGFLAIMTQDVFITTPGGKPQRIKNGETYVSNQATHVESEGFVGLLVVPLNTGGGSADVALRAIDDSGGAKLDHKANGQLDDVVSAVNESQRLLSERRGLEALKVIERSQEKYPRVSYLNFIKASCQVVLNQKQRAAEALNMALADFPKNAGGRPLSKPLAGKEFEEGKAH